MVLHLIDGTYELFRAYFSKRPSHLDDTGRDIKASLGTVQSILGLLQTENEPRYAAVAFDNPIRSFRNDLFAGYKSDEGVPEDLHSQFDLVEDGVRAAGIVVWSMRDFEADDALATGAHRWKDVCQQVRIYSPDKDLNQCLVGSQVIQIDRRQQKTIDVQTLLQSRGLLPESVPDWLALVGDTADGIPGLDGFGEKSASMLLAKYIHLENIPDRVLDWAVKPRQADRLAQVLSENRAAAMLYRKLATLRNDAPVGEELEDLRWTGVPRGSFKAWCARVKSDTLRQAVRIWSD